MISIKVYVSGNEFSSPWVNNWTGTLSLISNLPPNQLKFNYKFIYEKDKFLENNISIMQDINEINTLDWAVFISNEVLWSPENLLKLVDNVSYDVITGWHSNENGSTDIIEKLNTTELIRNNSINSMTPSGIIDRPLPFKIEYANMNFMAVKASIFSKMQTPFFSQVLLQEKTDISSNNVVFPWYYSFCNKVNEMGKEIFLDPNLRVAKISKSLL